ncbi:MAG: hypothetical protein JSU98_11395 [Gemmatimonadales bacterium]|jgi:hypothetical protein|nr:MAG: hypothetical protein JSU98_11395 [Gemmatimonadales bacterium]
MIGSLLTFFAVGLVTIIAAIVVLSVVGSVIGLVGSLTAFLLFKVAPVMLVGWVVLKLLNRRSGKELSAADRRWLEGE